MATLFSGIETLVTMDPLVKATPGRRLVKDDLGIIPDGALLVDNQGNVAWTGPRKDAPPAENRIDLAAKLVMPGFVDCHTHLIFAGDRADEFRRRAAGESYQDIAKSGGGILTTVKATREATEDELMDLAADRLEKFLQFGVTTVEVKSGYGLDEASEMKMLNVATRLRDAVWPKIVRTHLGAHAFPHDASRESWLERVKTSIGLWFKEGHFDHLDMFTEEGYFTLEESEQLILEAKKHGVPFKVHADELSAFGAAHLGAKHGAISVDHLLYYQKGSYAKELLPLMKKSGTVAVFLPGTAFYLKLPFADPKPCLESGIPVALSTDFNPGSCMSQNLPLMMTMGVLHMGMSVEETIAATTVQAARALRLSDVGHLTKGARADFQVYDVNYTNIVYEFGRPQPREVLIQGSPVMPGHPVYR